MSSIVTTFVNPPIPVRDSDWQATFAGYDDGDPVGHGPTEQAAIDDLREQEAYAQGRADERERLSPLLDALSFIAGTDAVDAVIDPQRAVRVARDAIARIEQ